MMFRYLPNLQVQDTSENYIAQEENNRTISTILPSIKKNAQLLFFFSFLNKFVLALIAVSNATDSKINDKSFRTISLLYTSSA